MTQSIEEFAAEHNVDANALKSLTGFIVDNIKGNETLQAAFFANPEAVIKAGVKAWHDRGTQMFSDLLENRTEWAQETRKAIAHDVWYTARKNAGLPTD